MSFDRTALKQAALIPHISEVAAPGTLEDWPVACMPWSQSHPLLSSVSVAPYDRERQSAARQLLRLALDLGTAEFGGPLTEAEQHVIKAAQGVPRTSDSCIEETRAAILAGGDPLGETLCRLWPAAERRTHGAFYTPPSLVEPMLDWALKQDPDRLVDPGCGSGRFAAGAVRRRPDLGVIAVDLDPVATLLTRANLAVLGARDATVLQTDYTALDLPPIAGRTAFVGNPPYVRHHDLPAAAKAWAVTAGRRLGHAVSALAGLHAHFYLATALYARPGDVGCFVTSAEWLDVKYGSVIRDLLLNGLGGRALHVIEPEAAPFADAMATAAIACFEVGPTPDTLRLRLVETPTDLASLDTGFDVPRDALAATARWSPLLRGRTAVSEASDSIPLGAVARVHRGVVTGANGFFVLTRERARDLGVAAWCRPAITSGKEILEADGVVRNNPKRKVLLDVPADIDRAAHPALDAYLRRGEQPHGNQPAIADRYIASRRRPWWCLGLGAPPSIVASYMARQAPAFALNPDGLAVVNIAHGLYPIGAVTMAELAGLVAALNDARESFRGAGRTYHGGLEKFEPREMEVLPIPRSLAQR